MWSTFALLPALAVLCHGAALPQVIGSPLPSAKPTTYTFVIPCPPNTNGCVPRTITMVGGADIEPMTLLPRDPQVLGDPTRTVLPTTPEPTSKSHSKTKHSHTTAVSSTETSLVTSTHKHHHTTPTVDARQVLGSPTRSVAPTWGFPGWPWWPQSIVTVTITKAVTQIPDTLTTVPVPPFSPTDDYYTPGVTRTVPALSVPLDRRDPQVLGEPTRTVLLTPTPLSTKKPHPPKPTTTSECDDVEKRQELGSPTRTVLVSPTPDPDPYPTVTVTVTTTVYPTDPWYPWPTKPSPPWWVTTRYPTSDPEPITRTVPPLTVPIGQRDPQLLGDPTRTVLLPTHSRRPITTWDDAEKRQVLGDPTGSVTWYTGGDDGLTTTVTLPGPTKRQVLGDPTQSFTWWEADGSEPTAPVMLEPPSSRAERRLRSCYGLDLNRKTCLFICQA